MGLRCSTCPEYAMEPASSVKLSQVDSYLNDYPEISQERKCHIASYKLFKVFLFGSPITPAVEYIGKLFVPTLVQLQQQQPASGELSRIADSSLTPAPELSQTLGSDSDLTKSSRASTPPRLRGGGDSITIHFLEPIRMSLINLRDEYAAQAVLYPNLLPYSNILVSDASAVLVRQYMQRTLTDRLYTQPTLTEMMKLWILYQLVCALAQLHALGRVHGDLKTENVFIVGGSEQVMLGDLGSFGVMKPATLPAGEAASAVFSLFFATASGIAPPGGDLPGMDREISHRGSYMARNRCYIAPERFDTDIRSNGGLGLLTNDPVFSSTQQQYDSFSLGCCIAEIFSADHSHTIFDLPDALRMHSLARSSGRNDKESEAHVAQATHHVRNPRIRKLIASLLSLDPTSRPLPLSLLMVPAMQSDSKESDKTSLFPRAFGEALLPLSGPQSRGDTLGTLRWLVGVIIQSNPIYMAADMRIDLIVRNLPYLIIMLVSRDTLLDHLRKLRYIGDGREPTASDFIQAVRRVVSDGCSNIDENTLSAVYESSQSQQFAFFQNQEHMQRPEALNGDQSIAIPHYDPLACGISGDGRPLPHPELRPSRCRAFHGMLLSLWKRSAEAHCQGGKVQADWEKHLSRNMTELLLLFFPDGPVVPEQEIDETSDGSDTDREVLFVLIGMVTSAGHAGSHPRTRQVSLMILETLAPFCSRHTLLELFIPHCHAALSTEPTAECRTQALRSLVAALECIPSTADTEESLYASGQFGGVTDTGAVYSLFVDYLWPVLLSLIATRSDANLLSYSAHAAVRLAALSVTIGEMSAPSGNPSTSLEAIKAAMYNFVATYLQQVFQRAPPGNNFSMMTPNGRAVSSTTTHSPDPSQLPPRAAEAVKLAVLEALPDFASLLPPCSKEPDSSQNQNLKGSHDVSVSSLTVPPLTVQNPSSGPRPSDHKDEETKKGSPDRGLTLPYLMCFLNDPNPQVKVAFCRLAPRCANLLGAFAADVALLPYFTQTLSKELGDDRLTLAALMGATELLGDYRVLPDEGPNSVHRESVMRFAESAVPYLCHPNVCIQATARALIRSITTKHIGNALQYVYLRRRSFSHLKEAEYLPNGWRCFGDLEYLCPVSYELVLGQQTIGETLGDTTDVARIGLAKKFYEGTVSHGQPMGEPMAVSTAGPMQIIKVSISNPNVPAILPYRFIAEGDVTLGFEGSVNKLLKDWRARHLLLPPPKPALGILNRLDGSQETLYVSKKKLQIVNEIRGVLGNDGESYGMYGHRRVRAQRLHLQCRAGVDPPSVEGMTLVTSPTMEAGSSPVAMDHNSTSNISESSISVGSLQSESAPLGNVEIDHAASNDSSGYSLATPSAWRPGGSLVGTIYDFEYDFGGGGSSQSVNSMSSGHPVDGRGASHTTPVVAVDASDDGRLIIAMGGNGVVGFLFSGSSNVFTQLRAWRGHILEDDVAPTCSKMMPLPDEELDLAAITHYHFPMKALRNCKSVVVGGASPSLYVYRMDAPGDVPVVSLRAPTCGKSAVVFDAGIAAIESFDTDIENVVIAANHHGSVFGFDVRAGRCVFNVAEPESSLGVPTDMLCSSDGRTTVLCTRSGFVSLFDVRYLSRRTRTYKLFQEGAGTGILPITAMCNSLHGGNKSFWLAEGTHGMMGLYDFTSLDGDVRPTKLMLCGEQSNPINLPVLVDMRSQPRQSFLVGADMLTQQVKECADPSSLVVRSMLEISTSRGGPWTLLSTGNDAVVRWWQPQEAGTVIPFSNQSSIMPLQLGGVQVMTNPSYAASSGHHQSSMTPRGQGTPVEEQGDSDLRVDDGHRDAILDMCVLSLQYDILVTAGRDGLIKIWR